MREERDPDFIRTWRKAIKMLAYKSRTVYEIRTALEKEKAAAETVERVIRELERYGYLDDRHYALRYAEIRLGRGYGPRRIRLELLHKGLPACLIDEALPAICDEEKELALAKKMAVKKAASGAIREQRLACYLQRRGFSDHVIIKVLRELVKDKDSLSLDINSCSEYNDNVY